MKKSELKALLKIIVAEAIEARKKLNETKGLSGFKKSSDKLDNTQMGKEDKSITSTDKPKEKSEGKKLPVKDSTKNTETDHTVDGLKSTPVVPGGEKQEKARPVGGHSALKEEILKIIREEIEEYRTKGALGAKNPMRKQPVKTYVAKGIAGMGRPKKGAEVGEEPAQEASGYTFVFKEPSGKSVDLDSDLPWYGQNQLNSYLEKNVMAYTGDLDAKLDPTVIQVLNNIKIRPETVQSRNFTLTYDKPTKTVKIDPIK